MNGIVLHICHSLVLLICSSVLCRGKQHCLTWDIQQERLRLICRVPGFSDPVSLNDSQGQLYAKCTFNRKVQQCTPYARNNSIVTNYTVKYVIFTIGKLNNNMNGLWICTQNGLRLTTYVSLSKGIIDSTDVRISGQVHDMKDNSKNILRCFSCREPDGNNVEFHENLRSMDSITFSHDTGNCIHHTGKCRPVDCSCNGLEFMRSFRYDRKRSVTTYSCEMVFTDTFTNQKFAILSTVFFNGNEFYNKTSSTAIIKLGVIVWDGTLISPDENEITSELNPTRVTAVIDSTVDNIVQKKGDLKPLHVIVIVIVCVIGIVFLLLFVRRHCNLKARYTNDLWHDEFDIESIPLLDNGIERSKMTVESYQIKEKHHFRLFVSTGVTKLYSCDPCSMKSMDRAALEFCFDCELALCAICAHTHDVMEVTKSHNCLNIKKIPKTISLPLPCEYHNTMKYQYYCLNHEYPCCITCIKTLHSGKGCQVKPIDANLKRFKETQPFFKYLHQLYLYYVCVLNCLIIYQYHIIDRITNITSSTSTVSGYGKINTNRKRIKSVTKQNADFVKIKVMLNSYAKETSDIHFSAEDQKALLDFMKSYGSERQLFILTHCLKQNMIKIYERVHKLFANTVHVCKNYAQLQMEQGVSVLADDLLVVALYNKLSHVIMLETV